MRVILFSIPVLSDKCGGNLTGSSGWFSPPDWDEDGLYDNDVQCYWTITTDVTRMIHLQFVTMDLEFDTTCGYDYIAVIHCI